MKNFLMILTHIIFYTNNRQNVQENITNNAPVFENQIEIKEKIDILKHVDLISLPIEKNKLTINYFLIGMKLILALSVVIFFILFFWKKNQNNSEKQSFLRIYFNEEKKYYVFDKEHQNELIVTKKNYYIKYIVPYLLDFLNKTAKRIKKEIDGVYYDKLIEIDLEKVQIKQSIVFGSYNNNFFLYCHKLSDKEESIFILDDQFEEHKTQLLDLNINIKNKDDFIAFVNFFIDKTKQKIIEEIWEKPLEKLSSLEIINYALDFFPKRKEVSEFSTDYYITNNLNQYKLNFISLYKNNYKIIRSNTSLFFSFFLTYIQNILAENIKLKIENINQNPISFFCHGLKYDILQKIPKEKIIQLEQELSDCWFFDEIYIVSKDGIFENDYCLKQIIEGIHESIDVFYFKKFLKKKQKKNIKDFVSKVPIEGQELQLEFMDIFDQMKSVLLTKEKIKDLVQDFQTKENKIKKIVKVFIYPERCFCCSLDTGLKIRSLLQDLSPFYENCKQNIRTEVEPRYRQFFGFSQCYTKYIEIDIYSIDEKLQKCQKFFLSDSTNFFHYLSNEKECFFLEAEDFQSFNESFYIKDQMSSFRTFFRDQIKKKIKQTRIKTLQDEDPTKIFIMSIDIYPNFIDIKNYRSEYFFTNDLGNKYLNLLHLDKTKKNIVYSYIAVFYNYFFSIIKDISQKNLKIDFTNEVNVTINMEKEEQTAILYKIISEKIIGLERGLEGCYLFAKNKVLSRLKWQHNPIDFFEKIISISNIESSIIINNKEKINLNFYDFLKKKQKKKFQNKIPEIKIEQDFLILPVSEITQKLQQFCLKEKEIIMSLKEFCNL